MPVGRTNRRAFIAALGGAAAWPLVARAQQPERGRRIGVVTAYLENDLNGQAQVAAFRERLGNLGWTEGRNLQIDFRYGADDPNRIREQARELLQLVPDLARRATSDFRPRRRGDRVKRRTFIAGLGGAAVWRSSRKQPEHECAGRNASERRASLEKDDAQAGCRVGLAPTGKRRLVTAHTRTGH